MKTIGLLGGTSWPSTIEYYRILNELAQEKLCGFHSANLLLYSIDYHDIKNRYHEGWDEIPILLKNEIEKLVQMGPDCIMICNNTLHKAFDEIKAELNLRIPIFHIVEITGEYAIKNHCKNLLLLGTKFTMEDGFYQNTLHKFGLATEIPDLDDRIKIQDVQTELAKGELNEDFRKAFRQIITKYDHLDAVILACTEIPLAVNQKDFDIMILNPSDLQCRKAFEFAAMDYPTNQWS
jgi:aspartate racemase